MQERIYGRTCPRKPGRHGFAAFSASEKSLHISTAFRGLAENPWISGQGASRNGESGRRARRAHRARGALRSGRRARGRCDRPLRRSRAVVDPSASPKSPPPSVPPRSGGTVVIAASPAPEPDGSPTITEQPLAITDPSACFRARTASRRMLGCLDGGRIRLRIVRFDVPPRRTSSSVSEDLRQLVEAAEERGSILQSELNDALEPLNLDALEIDLVHRELETRQIDLVERPRRGRRASRPSPSRRRPYRSRGRRPRTPCSSSCARRAVIRC